MTIQRSVRTAFKPSLRRTFPFVVLAAFTSLSAQADVEGPDDIGEFRIHVDDSVLVDLRQRLSRTRWPQQIDGSGWQYGVDLVWMKELVKHWQTRYDWREHEQRLNESPQFITRIDGIDLHFLHVRSPHAAARPIVLVHGWPGSFYEFHKLIPMLTEPEKHGGAAEDAFHVVVPSLPGFGFSGIPNETGWNPDCMAEVIAKLMQRLKYEQYGAQGGDWGAGIVQWLASHDGEHCIGAHSNYPLGGEPREDPMRGVSQNEIERYRRRRAEVANHRSYVFIQGTRPLTLGYGLNDSPVALAAWIVDKFHAWSDHGGDLKNSFSMDELLTNVMIYWVTDTMPSSTCIYYESRRHQPRPSTMTPFKPGGKRAPIGFALFPKEINVTPRAWVERNIGPQLVHWSEMPRGGHFAAMEAPDLLAGDMRRFFRSVDEQISRNELP